MLADSVVVPGSQDPSQRECVVVAKRPSDGDRQCQRMRDSVHTGIEAQRARNGVVAPKIESRGDLGSLRVEVAFGLHG